MQKCFVTLLLGMYGFKNYGWSAFFMNFTEFIDFLGKDGNLLYENLEPRKV